MGRPKGYSDLERGFINGVAEGKTLKDAAIDAGYSEATAKNAYRIMQRPLVGKGVETRRQNLQTTLALFGAGAPKFAVAMRGGLEDRDASWGRLWLEIEGIVGPERVRELASKWEGALAQAIGHAATVFVAFVDPNRRPEFEQKVAELRAQKLGEGGRS